MTDEKTTPMAKKIEMIANVAIIVAAAAIVFFFVRNYMRNQADSAPVIATGTKLALKDVSWQPNNKTIVLAVSTTCHFCSESAPFYRELVSQCKQQHVRTIAVLPQAIGEAQTYLQNEGVAVDDVRQVVFHDIPISGTPTLLLVDGSGTVKDVWVGKLPDSKEKEVLSKLTS
jgi:hypothetical protein